MSEETFAEINQVVQKLKADLMQDLLTGKVRVKVDEAEEVVSNVQLEIGF